MHLRFEYTPIVSSRVLCRIQGQIGVLNSSSSAIPEVAAKAIPMLPPTMAVYPSIRQGFDISR